MFSLYTPEHVAGLTGIAAADIERLAREYATSTPAVIRLNYGIQRSQNGGSAARAVCMLPALIGAWKQLGGGLQLSTSGAFAFNCTALERPDLMLASPLQRPARIVNMSRLGHALTELESPPVKALFVYNSNPAAIAPNQNAVVRGMMRSDLFTVVHEQFFTDTTDYADIVLPATTFPGTQRLSGSVRSLLSAAVGAGDRTAGRGAVERLAVRPTGPAHGLHRVLLPRQRRRSDRAGAGRETDAEELEAKKRIRMQSAAEQFADGVFATPSGKIEFYSSALAAQGLEPLPTFHPPDESRRGANAHKFPLEFLPRKADNYMNSTFANLPGHQKMESPGLAMMHASRRRRTADWRSRLGRDIQCPGKNSPARPHRWQRAGGSGRCQPQLEQAVDRGKQRERAYLRAAHRPGPRGHVLFHPGGSSKAQPGRSAKRVPSDRLRTPAQA